MKIYKEIKLRQGFGLQNRLYALERNFIEGQVSRLDALAAFKSEWRGVAELCKWCMENQGDDFSAATLLSKLAGVAGNLAFYSLSVQEQIDWRARGYSAAKCAELANDELGHGAQLAYLYFSTGNVDEALKLVDELLARNESLVESPGDAKLTSQAKFVRAPEERLSVRATLLSHRGMFLATRNRDEEALPILLEAADYFRRHQAAALSNCLNTLAIVQDHLGKHQHALNTANEALGLETPAARAMGLINRAGYLNSLGRVTEALESLKEGERVAIENGDQNAVGLASVQLAFWYTQHGNADERSSAVNRLEQALAIYRDTGDDRLRMKVLDALESVYLSAAEHEQSTAEQRTEAWRRLSSVREQLGKPELEIEASRKFAASAADDLELQLESSIRIGHAFVKLKQPEKAAEHHRAALELLDKLRSGSSTKNYDKAELELLLSLGQAQRASGKPEEAVTTHRRAQAIAEKTADEEAEWRARGNLALAQVDCGLFDEAILGLNKVAAHYAKPRESGIKPDLRLLGHARFNVAYAYHRQGRQDLAHEHAQETLRLLSLINDRLGVEKAKEQIANW